MLEARAEPRLFTAVNVSVINHHPRLEVPDPAYRQRVPLPRPRNFRQHMANTTFIQADYLGQFLDRLAASPVPTLVVVMSDTGYLLDDSPVSRSPVELDTRASSHRIFLLVVPLSPDQPLYAHGRVVEERFSQQAVRSGLTHLRYDKLTFVIASQARQSKI